MNKEELIENLKQIISEGSRTADERTEAAFALREAFSAEEDRERREADIEVYSALAGMYESLNGEHVYDLELMQLYVLLAELYVELEDYEPVKEVAFCVVDLLRDDMTPFAILNLTVPRIVAAIGDTVYNHYRYEILARYVKIAVADGHFDSEMKPYAEKMLRLCALLDDREWCESLIDKNMRAALAKAFDIEELLGMLVAPQSGMLRKDPVEYTWRWEEVYYEMIAEVDHLLEDMPRGMGSCFRYWSMEQQVLKEKYGIDWHTPSQMNPRVRFD